MKEVKELLKDELNNEYATTRKFIERFPNDQAEYRPHEKSMKMLPLAQHIVEIFGWPKFILDTDYVDFADENSGYVRPVNKDELLAHLDKGIKENIEALDAMNPAQFDDRWLLKYQGHTIADWDKYESIRHSLNQITHHRAQLGVYYRLLGIPVPGSYGPSADEQ
jgi:uncharacterized damage-inducible protein DinB